MPRASAASGALLRGKDPVVARLVSSPLDLVASLRTLRAEARADMPRAQLLASLLVATLFAAIGASRPWWSTELPEFPIAVPTVHEFMEPPSITPPGGGAPAAPTRVAVVDPHAVPNVVPEALPSDAIGPTPPSSTVPGGTGAEGTTTPLVPGPVDIRPVAERVPDIWETHDVEPEPLFTPRPEYTDIAQQANVEGTVVLRALVERDGRVGEIRVERSVPLLDEAARTAIARWTFTPARTHGVAVRAWVLIPVRFSLRDGR